MFGNLLVVPWTPIELEDQWREWENLLLQQVNISLIIFWPKTTIFGSIEPDKYPKLSLQADEDFQARVSQLSLYEEASEEASVEETSVEDAST